MPYRLTTFDNIPLPDARPIDDLSAAPAESTLAVSINDAFDYWGTDRRLPRIQQIEMVGMYVGQTPYLVDELGNFIVDELGNNIVVGGDYITSLRNQTDDLKRKIGRRGYLVRQREDDSTLQQKRARLLTVEQKAQVDDVKRVASIKAVFETLEPAWRDQSLTTASVSYAAGANALTCTVDGTEDITDAIIRLTATTNTSTVRVVYAGVDWTYSGTITAGNVLTTACVIPDKSMWRLRLVSIFMIDVGAATAKSMWVHCTMPQINRVLDAAGAGFTTNALPQTLFFVDPIARAAINRAAGSWCPPVDFFVPGGSTIRGTLGAPLANDISINFTVLYEEMGALPQ